MTNDQDTTKKVKPTVKVQPKTKEASAEQLKQYNSRLDKLIEKKQSNVKSDTIK